MRILVLEDDSYRVGIFVNKFHEHELIITENAYDAIEYLTTSTFDVIFLDHDLGFDNGSGSLVSSFLRENVNNRNNKAQIIIHSWNIPAAHNMLKDLPDSYLVPFASQEFYSIQLPK
jgi:DNA-binding response OmpR family regulator